MKIEVTRENSGRYVVRASAIVAASAKSVVATFMDEMRATKLRDVKRCSKWELQDDGSVFARYEMKPPAIDFGIFLKKKDAHTIQFWTPPETEDSWCVIHGAWKVHPIFFGRSFVSLEQTIDIRSMWLRMIPIQGLVKGRIKNVFEDLRDDDSQPRWCACFSKISSSSTIE